MISALSFFFNGIYVSSVMKIKALFLTIFFSLCLAQSDEYVIQQWNVEDGLPQSTVRCIAQTHDGYLWVGTWNGIARFDGVRMKVFNVGNTPALITANTMSLYCDSKDRLWIGTDAGGLVKYKEGTFTRFDSTDGFEATRILSIAEDQSGRMWFATEIGVYVYDGKKFLHFTKANGLAQSYVGQVLSSADGKMYVGLITTGSIVHLEKDSLVIEQTFPAGGFVVATDSLGTLWYGIREKGFVQRKNGNTIIDRRFAGINSNDTYILRNGEKWLLTQNDIRIVADSSRRILQTVDGVQLSDITSVLEDREGNIWMGKEGGGLILLRKKQVVVLSKQNGFPANRIMTGVQDHQGSVWIGTWDNGILKSVNGSYQKFVRMPLFKPDVGIFSIAESRDSTLLIGAWANGLLSIHNNHSEHISRGMIDRHTSIISAVGDTKNRIWVGTAHDGVVCFSGNEEHVWNTSNGLSSNRVNDILCAKNGDVWISVSANGVNRISEDKLTVFKKENGLNDNSAHPMYEDDDGNIWIGTNRGLNRWKPDQRNVPGGKGSFAYVTEEQGLFDNAIGQIIQDNDGNFWIGAIHGICRVNKQELNDVADGKIKTIKCLTIGKEDGMLSESAGGGGTNRCWKTTDGRLWFSTSQGVVIIDPKRIESNTIPPSVIIDEVLIDNRIEKMSSEITLKPEETKLELGYSGIHFSAPKKIRFEYMLEGFEKKWNDVGTKRIAQYTNINPGTYTFRLKAQSNSGVWSTQEATVRIIVLPKYYETWWFRLVIVFLFVTVGPLIYIVRVRQLKREQQRQHEISQLLIESQEAERKRIAQEMHDSLGQELLVIKNRAVMGLKTAAEESKEKRQLEQISSGATNILKLVRSLSHNLRPPELDRLGLTETIRSILTNVREASEIILNAEVDEIDGLVKKENEINLIRILQEVLSNIEKHSDASEVTIGITVANEQILFTIRDNGKGFSPEEVKHGIGLAGISERVRILQGSLSIISSGGGGATVTITIPVYKNTAHQ